MFIPCISKCGIGVIFNDRDDLGQWMSILPIDFNNVSYGTCLHLRFFRAPCLMILEKRNATVVKFQKHRKCLYQNQFKLRPRRDVTVLMKARTWVRKYWCSAWSGKVAEFVSRFCCTSRLRASPPDATRALTVSLRLLFHIPTSIGSTTPRN